MTYVVDWPEESDEMGRVWFVARRRVVPGPEAVAERAQLLIRGGIIGTWSVWPQQRFQLGLNSGYVCNLIFDR